MNEFLLTLFTLAVCLLLGTAICALFSADVRNRIGLKTKTLKVSAVVLFCLMLVSLWFETPTSLGDHLYLERDLANHKQTIHTSSSCPKIKDGYNLVDVKSYEYTPYFDEFCKRCVYKSDAIKLSEKK